MQTLLHFFERGGINGNYDYGIMSYEFGEG